MVSGGMPTGPGGVSYDDVMNIVNNNQTPLEKEANSVWTKLDHLAKTDPTEYKKFVAEQMKEGQEYMKQCKENGGKPPGPKPTKPESRFWVETALLDSNGKEHPSITRIFNVCESETMDFTDDQNFNIYMSDLDDRQIDCVIHPFFMKKIQDDNLFLDDAVRLIFKTYEEEHAEKEKVKRQYKYHNEPRRLRMKMPKKKAPDPAEESAMDVLSRVRHSDAAKQMAVDEERERRRRLFDLHGPPKPAAPKAPAAPTATSDPTPAPAPPKPPLIEEVLPALVYELTRTDAGCTVMVTLPDGADPASLSVEIESASATGGTTALLVEAPERRPLRLPLPCAATEHTAKFLRKKNKLKIEVKS